MVITVMQADYRGRGSSDLVICMRNGDGKTDIAFAGSDWWAIDWAQTILGHKQF